MEMQNQEVCQESELEGFYPINQLASLHLTSAPSITITSSTNHHYASSGKSVKRISPSDSDSADSERKSKKAMVVQDYHHSPPLGFTKIDLPISFPIIPSNNPQPPSSPVLRRSFSDVDNFPSPPDSVTGSANAAIGVNSTIASPLFPVLQRSASDPIPLASLTRSNSQSASSGEMVVGFPVPVDTVKEESPNMKKLRRMKELMREMNQWLDEVMREGEDDNSGVVTATQDSLGTEGEEEVSVERLGEYMSINFKCPCSRGCQILISGRECYYKLV